MISLPNSVFYVANGDLRCKEHSETEFESCLDFKVASDSYGEYITEVTIGLTGSAYNAGDIITFKIDTIVNKFNSQSLNSALLSSTI